MNNVTFYFTTRPGNILSWCIRQVSGRPFSHVIVEADDVALDRTFLFEATLPDVTLGNPEWLMAGETVVESVSIPVSDAENTSVLQFMLDNSGKTYATLKLFGILWQRLLARFGRTVVNPADDSDKTEECAEAGALILTRCLGLKTTIDVQSVDPGWVYDQATAMLAARTK